MVVQGKRRIHERGHPLVMGWLAAKGVLAIQKQNPE
jgi:hypothetical protein